MLKFTITDENNKTKEMTFPEDIITVGRSSKNPISLPDDFRISGNHCQFTYKKNKIYIKDLGSRNGTFLNEKAVGTEEYEVKPDDKVRVGRTIITVSCIQKASSDADEIPLSEGVEIERETAEPPKFIKSVGKLITQLTGLKTIGDKEAFSNEKTLKIDDKQNISEKIDEIQTQIKHTQKIMERYVALNKSAQTINSCLDLKVQLARILDEAMTLLDAQEGFLISFDKQKKTTKEEASKQVDHMKKFQPFYSREVVNFCISRGKPVLLGEARGSKDFSQSGSIMNIASIVCAPIRFADEILGVIYLDDKTNLNKFDEEDLELLLTFASNCAVAMKNARLIEQIKKDERRMISLQRFLPHNVASKVADSSILINLGGEKRNCSIMFTDIRGFTSLSENLSPLETVNLLNEYFSNMVSIIFKYQGTLDKFLGDGIMAIFGAPISIENHAIAAIKTAIEMQEAVRSLNLRKSDEERITFEIGIGIDTGDVIAGNIGSNERMEYTVIGRNANISSRLCAIAEAGQIVVTESTLEQIQNVEKNFKSKFIGAKKLKGIAKEVNAYSIEYSLL